MVVGVVGVVGVRGGIFSLIYISFFVFSFGASQNILSRMHTFSRVSTLSRSRGLLASSSSSTRTKKKGSRLLATWKRASPKRHDKSRGFPRPVRGSTRWENPFQKPSNACADSRNVSFDTSACSQTRVGDGH